MDSEQILKIIGVVVFLIGLICVGGVVYFLIWRFPMVQTWDHLYTWLIIIGAPCFTIGVVMVNKYLKSS